ncbi:MAG: hypothetical protein JWM11_4471 [Planctomycetaceae bacterium]|nr:hypothetical protein [Planctomycetaceae bacterium]
MMNSASGFRTHCQFRDSILVKTMFALIFAGCVFPNPSLAQGTTSLIKWLPDTSNSIAIVQVQDILKSQKATVEHWADKHGERTLFSPGMVPPWVETLAVGSQVRLATSTREWSASVMAVPPQFSLEGLAHRENAHVEELAGHRAVHGQRDALFIDLGERVLGVMSPAHRQEAARWVRHAAQPGHGLSEYLSETALSSAQIVMAIDLLDTFDVAAAHEFVGDQEILKTSKIPAAEIVELLKSLRGVHVSVTIDDAIDAKISLDFGKPVKIAPAILKSLAVSMIDDHGLHIAELEHAEPVNVGRSCELRMMGLSDESLRAILSLMVTVTPERSAKHESNVGKAGAKPAATPNGAFAEVPEADATRHYLDAVNKIIGDLEKSLIHVHNYILTATYHDNYAARIEHLPVAGVSTDVLEYGGRVSARLRGLAASLRGVAVTVNAQQGTLVYNTTVTPGASYRRYGVWGGRGYRPPTFKVTSNLQAVRERQAAAVIKGQKQREDIWNLIRDDRNSMIRKVQ